jgi:hypothetical protein
MNFRRVLVFCALMSLPANGAFAQARAELPDDVTLELLGRCFLYSFSYQHTFDERAGLELGFSVLGGSDASAVFFSAGGRFYLSKRNAAPCISAGIVFLSAGTSSGPFDTNASTTYAYLGPGFEYRSDGGFVFRGTLNFLIRDGFFVWPGFQIGVAF